MSFQTTNSSLFNSPSFIDVMYNIEGTWIGTGAGPEATENGDGSEPAWINNPAANIREYFSMKSKLREEEKQHWEEIGDQDLIGKERRFGMKRIFWKGSLDSQGFKTAQSIEVKDIFRHCIRVNFSCDSMFINLLAIFEAVVRSKGVLSKISYLLWSRDLSIYERSIIWCKIFPNFKHLTLFCCGRGLMS